LVERGKRGVGVVGLVRESGWGENEQIKSHYLTVYWYCMSSGSIERSPLEQDSKVL